MKNSGKQSFQQQSKQDYLSLKFFVLILITISLISTNITKANTIKNAKYQQKGQQESPINPSEPAPKRCAHPTNTPRFLTDPPRLPSRVSATQFFKSESFQPLRIHLDFSHTLPHEAEVLQNVVFPPITRFFESALKVKRTPGRLRFPSSMASCGFVDVTEEMRRDGYDADVVIFVTTYKGMKKKFYEDSLLRVEQRLGNTEQVKIKNIGNESEKATGSRNNIGNGKKAQRVEKVELDGEGESEELKDFGDQLLSGLNGVEGNSAAFELGLDSAFTHKHESFQHNSHSFRFKSQKLNSESLSSFKSKAENNTDSTTPDANTTVNNSSNCTTTPPHLPWEDESDIPLGIIGWASSCLQDTNTKRSVAGLIQFVSNLVFTIKDIEETIWTALHELTHVFVMDIGLMKDFIKEDFTNYKINEVFAMRSSLEGFQELIDARKHLMNDYFGFLTFNGTAANNETAQAKGSVDKNNKKDINADGKDVLNKAKRSFQKEKSETVYGVDKIQRGLQPDSSQTEILTTAGNNENNAKFFSERYEENKETKINKLSKGNNQRKENKAEPESQPAPQNSTNTTNSTLTPESNPKPSRPKALILPVSPNFTDIKLPDNFNLYTVMYAIENFAENTKLYIKTPKVKEVAQNHFNCARAHGMQLESNGEAGSSFVHWSKRVLNTEFMIPDVYGEYFVSNFTLALFQDSGWYQADFRLGQALVWGRNQGCSFLYDKCIVPVPVFPDHSLVYDRLGLRREGGFREDDNVSSVESIQAKSKGFNGGYGLGKRNTFTRRLENLALNSKELRGKAPSEILEKVEETKEGKIKVKEEGVDRKADNGSLNPSVLPPEPKQSAPAYKTPVFFKPRFKEFCEGEQDSEVCSLSRTFRASCRVVQYSKALPVHYQYYSKSNLGGSSDFGDFCPYPKEKYIFDDLGFRIVGSCQSGEVLNGQFHEKICANCKCIVSNLVSKESFVDKGLVGKLAKFELVSTSNDNRNLNSSHSDSKGDKINNNKSEKSRNNSLNKGAREYSQIEYLNNSIGNLGPTEQRKSVLTKRLLHKPEVNSNINYSSSTPKSIEYLNAHYNFLIQNYHRIFPKAAVCYKVFCKTTNSMLNRLPLKLLLLVGKEEIECPYQGGEVTSDLFFGSVLCPMTEEVCVGDLNPLESYQSISSFQLLSDVKDGIIKYYNKKYPY